MSEWISIKDRLPENDALVLVCQQDVKDAATFIAFFINGRWAILNNEFTVTHWMPLPEPPNES